MKFSIAGSSRVLLLQGPMGSFFSRFDRHLRSHGVHVWKMNFNGGDWIYSRGQNTIDFRGEIAHWPQFLSQVLRTHRIDRIFLFGDSRAYHRDAIKVAREMGIRVEVFEEGYIRPNYITLEENGVNGFSSLPRDPHFYLSQPEPAQEPAELPAHTDFWSMAQAAMTYYLAGALLRPYFPHYEHHKRFSVITKGSIWCRSGLRKKLYAARDNKVTARLAGSLSKRYFLAVLQVYNDSQVKFHSSYADVTAFIEEVIASFALHAPADACLVLKHHPMDRGARHYGKLIDRLRNQYALGERIIYAHQIHLPTALDHTRGVVVINSTVGLSAMLHGAPVKTMGQAIYDMEGLTCQSPLDAFWKNPGTVSKRLLAAFRRYVVETTQINGSFFGLDPFRPGADRAPEPALDPAMQKARPVRVMPATFDDPLLAPMPARAGARMADDYGRKLVMRNDDVFSSKPGVRAYQAEEA